VKFAWANVKRALWHWRNSSDPRKSCLMDRHESPYFYCIACRIDLSEPSEGWTCMEAVGGEFSSWLSTRLENNCEIVCYVASMQYLEIVDNLQIMSLSSFLVVVPFQSHILFIHARGIAKSSKQKHGLAHAKRSLVLVGGT